MRSINTRIGRAAAVLSAVAAMAALGSGVAQAAPAWHGPLGAAPATGLTWHKLTLINGWASSDSRYHTGPPSWAMKNGIVYLSGSMHAPSGSPAEFAKLPKAVRPAHTNYIGIYTYGFTYGQLIVQPTGQMDVSGPVSSRPRRYSSLAGVTFPAAHTPGTKLHLLNGWKAGPPADTDGPPSFTVRGGVVYLSGEQQGTSSTSLLMAVLPKSARPAAVLFITALSDLWTPATLRISPNGDVFLYGGHVLDVSEFDGLSFSVARTGWKPLKLKNGWESLQSTDHTGVPSYRVSGGLVYFTGAIRQNSAGSDHFAVLPPAVRPKHDLYIRTWTIGGTEGTVWIQRNGVMSAIGTPQNNAVVFTSLADISYPLGS